VYGGTGLSRYEQLKLAGKTFVGGRDLNSLEMAGVGAFAGGFTGFVTTPLDVIKTRLMTQVRTLFMITSSSRGTGSQTPAGAFVEILWTAERKSVSAGGRLPMQRLFTYPCLCFFNAGATALLLAWQ